MTLTIIEGPDCAGKSTLAGRVVDLLRRTYPGEHVEYRHCGVPTQHPLDEYVAPLLDYRPGTGRHVVCDRWHVGETVYPAVLDRPTDMTNAVRAYVEAFLRSRGARLIYCQASYQHLVDCGIARDDPVDEVERVPAVRAAFDRAVAQTSLRTSAVDATRPIPGYLDDVARQVVAYGSHAAAQAEVLNAFRTYVGSPRPRLLLVGDRRGTPSHDLAEFGDWPAFVPRAGTSGDYLLRTLTLDELRVHRHGLTIGDVGFANACDVDDVHALWLTLGRPSVVGLGNNAQRALRELKVPYREARHPQYVRRFTHHDRVNYLQTLLPSTRSVVA